MTITIQNDPPKTTVERIFYVTEDNNSPYQGRLMFTPEEHATLTDDTLAAMQTDQFNVWKANLIALQNAPPPTPDDLAQQAIDAQSQIDDLNSQIATLTADPDVAASVAALNPDVAAEIAVANTSVATAVTNAAIVAEPMSPAQPAPAMKG